MIYAGRLKKLSIAEIFGATVKWAITRGGGDTRYIQKL